MQAVINNVYRLPYIHFFDSFTHYTKCTRCLILGLDHEREMESNTGGNNEDSIEQVIEHASNEEESSVDTTFDQSKSVPEQVTSQV